MKKSVFIISLFILSGVIVQAGEIKSKTPAEKKTFCNPMDLNYHFNFRSEPLGNDMFFREAADPVVHLYKGTYFLFASHSGGYWYSDNMLNWKFIAIKSMPIIGEYAPDVLIKGDTVFYIGSSLEKNNIYFTTNPFEDQWKPMKQKLSIAVWDPCFFKDDDGKVYLYWGISNFMPMYGVQLDANLQPMTDRVALFDPNMQEHGWEIWIDGNKERKGFCEGAWMTKYKNQYYLQYAAPATQLKIYGDGVYKSDSPLGPFKFESYSPFSYKPGGFISGSGHSATFLDKYGNYWHITSLSVSVRNPYERRLGLFPAAFDKDGVLHTYTAFGDYPTKMPTRKIDFEKEDLFKGWMLLSYNKKLTASSSMEKFPVANAADENIQTWWSAKTGNKGEWLSIELDNNVTINAIQLNFADNEAKLRPESKVLPYCYKVLASNDQKTWKVIIDKSNNTKDACHEYIELDKPLKAKYIKVENVQVPEGKFSIYDLRIFGLKEGKNPQKVTEFEVNRNADSRKATVKWTKDKSATGYVVNYGIDANKLYTSFMVYDSDSVKLTGLNKGITYYFSIDTFNESGITKGTKIITVK